MSEPESVGSVVPHPLVDSVGDGYVVTESRARILFLTAARVSLLTQANAAGLRVVLATDELSVMTTALAELWRAAGATWLVRHPDGTMRNGFTGAKLDEISQIFTRTITSVDDVSLTSLRPIDAGAVELIVTLSLRHRAKATTMLGRPAEALAQLLTGSVPTAWGAHEPAGNTWDRAAMTTFARDRMPADTLIVATAAGFAATITAARSTEGIEETTQAHLNAGTPTTVEFDTLREKLAALLTDLAATSLPLVGVVLTRPSRADLMISPTLQPPPAPIALLIGAPAVRSLGLSPEKMVADLGATIVGRPRIPALLFAFDVLGEPTWQQLDAVLSAIGRERLHDALGSTATWLTSLPEGGDGGE